MRQRNGQGAAVAGQERTEGNAVATDGLAALLTERLAARGMMLASAESCTGGLIAALMTERGGASAVFHSGFVTYANAAKTAMLGVPEPLLAAHGAVSREVAIAMATGALERSGAGVAVAVTGIAGPGGGSTEKPVGLVHIAAAAQDGRTAHAAHQFGNPGRSAIRAAAVTAALQLVLDLLDQG
jgi:nicotinamide-nucleotide amidase